jgi:ABC-2 type transport system ATP-binding protein
VVGALDAADISRVLGEQGLWVRELAPEHADLESVFLRLTDKDRSHGEREEER